MIDFMVKKRLIIAYFGKNTLKTFAKILLNAIFRRNKKSFNNHAE